jgi:hypothetical protein
MAKKAGLSKEDTKDKGRRKAAVKGYLEKTKGEVSEAQVSTIIESTDNTDHNVVSYPYQ